MYAKVTIVGNIGQEPRISDANGKLVANFSVAVGEWNPTTKTEETTWWKVSAWGKAAEFVRDHCGKGRTVLVEGRPRIDKWTNKSGEPVADLAVMASDVKGIGKKPAGDGASGGGGGGWSGSGGSGWSGGNKAPASTPADDDIPF